MEDHRLPEIVLYGELSSGHRDREVPKKRFKDCLKKSLKSCHIDPNQWTTEAAERDGWRQTVYKAANNFEIARREALEEKQQRRKTRAASTPSNPNPDQTFTFGSVQQNVPVSDRPRQPRAGLQKTLTFFLIFVREA